MTNTRRVCPKCGATVFADAPQGCCSVCLVRTGLASLDNEDEEAFEPTVARMLKDFGDYELLQEIGRGGQGVVYRARQKSLNRIVALKVIGLAHWATEAHVKRFRLEAEAAASLNHPCIVPIYEVGERDGACYFGMGLVEGGQLDAVAKREPIPIRHAAELIAKLARTVSYAHEHGILHRDIKPGNILLDAEGEPHLTDFGLARLVETESTVTRTMEVLGTPSYMAPEQAVGNNTSVTSATDIYGLGAVLYQLLTGHPPFAGGTTYETVRLVLDTEPRQPRQLNPKIDRDLSTICLKCLEKDPRRRYSSALALAEDLERWLKHEPIRARRTGLFTRGRKWVRRNPTTAVLVIALVAVVGTMIWKSDLVQRPTTTGIAVLPFENLSDDKESAFFANGVQDDILTKLAKIADLKVISRTSVMPYRGARNTRQIGDALRVSHVLEGSVQRAGGRVRVNAQLIDTRTDTHIWAEEYERDLTDVFVIQSEIAQQIANQLQVKLSPKEKTAISERPTSDLAAYDLFLRAKELFYDGEVNPSRLRENYFKAVQLLDQALARDPAFLLAHCRVAYAHLLLYWFNFDHTETRLALAETSVRAAIRLQPDSGETHFVQATLFYRGYRDYDRALEELAKAQHALPNDVQIFMFIGIIDRRQGRWAEAIRNLERALDLDPRNVERLWRLGEIYSSNLRRYGDAIARVNRALALEPRSAFLRALPAAIGVEADANMAPLRATLNEIEAERPASAAEVANISFQLALRERDPAAAAHALANIPSEGKGTTYYSDIPRPHAWFEGLLAKLRQDSPTAHSAFKAARAETEKLVRAQPGNVTPLNVLALIDAELGEKEKAIQEGRTACDMVPVARDAVDGVGLVTDLARIYALTGEKDLALKQLEIVSRIPCGPSYGELRLDSEWDSLRGDPRFDKLVEEAKQPFALK
jgi:TolB-like protein/Tfp pilus assembly protein PilF/predicted Ser/Thr protein kinase